MKTKEELVEYGSFEQFQLKVFPARAGRQYKHTAKDVQEIGKDLAGRALHRLFSQKTR